MWADNRCTLSHDILCCLALKDFFFLTQLGASTVSEKGRLRSLYPQIPHYAFSFFFPLHLAQCSHERKTEREWVRASEREGECLRERTGNSGRGFCHCRTYVRYRRDPVVRLQRWWRWVVVGFGGFGEDAVSSRRNQTAKSGKSLKRTREERDGFLPAFSTFWSFFFSASCLRL